MKATQNYKYYIKHFNDVQLLNIYIIIRTEAQLSRVKHISLDFLRSRMNFSHYHKMRNIFPRYRTIFSKY